MPGIRSEHATDGKLATAISNLVVQSLRHYTGPGAVPRDRGPTFTTS